MKRTYLLVMLAMFFASTAMGQIQFGAKAGVTSTSINADQTIKSIENQDYEQLKVQGKGATINGFQAGIFGRISLAALYVQPELLYTSTSTDVEVTTLTSSGEEVANYVKAQKFSEIDIPIMAGWKFGPARVQAGPVASIVLNNESALEAALNNATEKFNSATWGYQVGVGLDLLNTLTFDVKYEGSLSKFGEGVTIGGEERKFDSRPNQFIFSLGLFF